MDFKALEEFLKGPFDYEKGLKLLKKHSKNTFLIKMLSQKQSIFNKKKMLEELSFIAKGQKSTQNSNKNPIKQPEKKPIQNTSGLPKELFELSLKAQDAFKQMRHLHSTLLFLNDRERAQAAFKILELEKICTPIWAAIDNWKRTGTLPPPPQEIKKKLPVSREELLKRKYNLRSYISRGAISYALELEEIEKILNNDKRA